MRSDGGGEMEKCVEKGAILWGNAEIGDQITNPEKKIVRSIVWRKGKGKLRGNGT